MTLGRPTLGRWDPDPMNICPASDTEKVDETASLSTTPRILHHRNQSSTPLRPTPTNHHSRNASIRLLSPPLVRNASPPPFHDLSAFPSRLLSSQCIMRNRYHNLRLLIYRPVLHSYANRAIPFASLQPDEQAAVQKYRAIACAAIEETVAMMHMPSKLRVWSGAWSLY
jgi:hypothetical protein